VATAGFRQAAVSSNVSRRFLRVKTNNAEESYSKKWSKDASFLSRDEIKGLEPGS
jgi:hypothetical protein